MCNCYGSEITFASRRRSRGNTIYSPYAGRVRNFRTLFLTDFIRLVIDFDFYERSIFVNIAVVSVWSVR